MEHACSCGGVDGRSCDRVVVVGNVIRSSLCRSGMSICARSSPAHPSQQCHVIMPFPDNSKLVLSLLQEPPFHMPFQLFQSSPERARRPSRPATASILEGPAGFVLPVPSVQDIQVCTTNPQPTLSQTTPPLCTEGDYGPMSGMHISHSVSLTLTISRFFDAHERFSITTDADALRL